MMLKTHHCGQLTKAQDRAAGRIQDQGDDPPDGGDDDAGPGLPDPLGDAPPRGDGQEQQHHVDGHSRAGEHAHPGAGAGRRLADLRLRQLDLLTHQGREVLAHRRDQLADRPVVRRTVVHRANQRWPDRRLPAHRSPSRRAALRPVAGVPAPTEDDCCQPASRSESLCPCFDRVDAQDDSPGTSPAV